MGSREQERVDSLAVEKESERLKALRDYDILDTAPENEFDELVSLASEICGTPIALMSLVDANRQWFKSAIGLDFRETPRTMSFCARTIETDDILVVDDATRDARFKSNPLVTGPSHLRFYAGYPIRSHDGHKLGSFCILDRIPRSMTTLQRKTLRVLGHQVEAQLEQRARVRALASGEAAIRVSRDALERLQQQKDGLSAMVAHDLKNSIAAILSNVEFLMGEEKLLAGDHLDAARDIQVAAGNLLRLATNLMDLSSSGGRLEVRLRPLRIRPFLASVASSIRSRADRKGHAVFVESGDMELVADELLLRRVLDNLLDNALKYGPYEFGILKISAESVVPDAVDLVVADNGRGIPHADRERIFERYVQLSARATTEPSSSGRGLGLAFCRLAVEAHGGTIVAEENVPTGARFRIRLPFLR